MYLVRRLLREQSPRRQQRPDDQRSFDDLFQAGLFAKALCSGPQFLHEASTRLSIAKRFEFNRIWRSILWFLLGHKYAYSVSIDNRRL
jgi:hypothetical protein